MVNGQWYNTHDPALANARGYAKFLCQRLDRLPMDAQQKRAQLVKKLLPNAPLLMPCGGFFCDYGVNIYATDTVNLGRNLVILDSAPVTIGSNCTFEDNVVIAAVTHALGARERQKGMQQALPIRIGNNVVIGAGASILMGAIIADNTTIPAGAVVTTPRI
jgi:acetyltransferase-like isoleucine patch superfamily enzyme